MSSERKTQPARANGAKSRGPKTAEGKARSARNAVTHGLNSETVVLSAESDERFEKFRARYFADLGPPQPGRSRPGRSNRRRLLAPRTCLEPRTSLVDLEIARQRAQIEREFERIDDCVRTAIAFKSLADDSRSLALLSRYETRFERIIHRSLETLNRLREIEKQNLPNEPNPTSEHPVERAETGTDSSVPGRLLAPPTPAEPSTSPHNPQPTTHSQHFRPHLAALTSCLKARR